MQEELIFHQALELAADRRAAYLDEACGEDAALRRRIDVLLRAHTNPGSFLASPPAAVGAGGTPDPSISERPGQQIGPYKLLQQIGEGGMGVVYMAEQLEPVQRRVALKIIKPGMDTRQVIARFEAERQALALMDHPNIAKVLDAGTTGTGAKSATRKVLHSVSHQASQEQAIPVNPASELGTLDMEVASEVELRTANLLAGRPYFVMELVRGVPITHYCDEHQLPLRRRLELFVTVCQAIQHAHQKGIIHRDIKPTNVLVAEYDEQAVAKIIDFGVAKAIGARLTEKTLFTEFGQLVGTLEYMSPEQAKLNQLDIDTRSDIYSLGVLLYELLTGTTPLNRKQLKDSSLLELLRIVREQDAPTLSNRLNTTKELPAIAAKRGLEPASLTKLLRGELDWIVTKALEKDRSRRYETAGSLALDVQRYLADETVEACPPSASYRFRKFARRNRAMLMTGVVVTFAVLLTVAGLGASTFLIARQQRTTTKALHAEILAKGDLQNALDRERDVLERERWNSYRQRIALAEREWSANNSSRLEALLQQCPEDLRGWEWRYLKRLRYSTLLPLRHESPVYMATFSLDGQYMATATKDGFVRLWGGKTFQVLQTWRAHEANATSLHFSPDSRYLASGGWDSAVKVWDIDQVLRGKVDSPLLRLEHSDRIRVWGVGFSPNGRRLASGGGRDEDGKGEVKVWNLESGQEDLSLSRFTGSVRCVQFSPNGRQFVTGSEKLVQFWDAQTGEEKLSLGTGDLRVAEVVYSPDGRRVAAGGGQLAIYPDPEVKVWDASTGEEQLSLRGHVGGLWSVAFSPDSKRLASAGLDQTIKLWDLKTGQEVLTLRGHLDHAMSIQFSPDGRQLVSASLDKTVRIWDATPLERVSNPECLTLLGHDGAVTDVEFHPTDGHSVVSAGTDGTVRIWDFWSGEPLDTLHVAPSDKRVSAAYSPDGRRLVAASQGFAQPVKVWNVATHKEICQFPSTFLTGDVSFSPDGQHVASAGYDFAVRVWDATTADEVRAFTDHTWPIFGVAFSPNGRHLASGSGDTTVRIWDWTTGERLPLLRPQHAGRVACVQFSRDGKLLASASWDRTVKVWDAVSWQLLYDLPHPSSPQCVAFDRDGPRLAWGSIDGTVTVWDGPDRDVHTLRGHTSWVQAVDFSADGKWIASASLDGTVKIWDAPPLPEAQDQELSKPEESSDLTRGEED